MTKRVLVLGAGLVSKPLVDYLLKNTDFVLTVADIRLSQAEKVLNGSSRGTARALDVSREAELGELVAGADLVVSLLPYSLHPIVARHCISAGVHMLNASYVGDEIRAMDAAAKSKGVLLLCELGLDPGIDHMSAMRIIHDVRQRGGYVSRFRSVCGGLPAPEANDNPFGYKFSWSPLGVIMAGNSSARYQDDGQAVRIEAEKLFDKSWDTEIDGMQFEAYPNRDSMPYVELYGLEHVKDLLRGTLRNRGWSKIMMTLKRLGLTNPEAHGLTSPYSPQELVTAASKTPDALADIQEPLVKAALLWLGLDDTQPREWEGDSPLKCLAEIMSHRMGYGPEERDMVVLRHDFEATFPDHRELIASSLVDYGIPGGSSSMARTVSLPLAVAAKHILSGDIALTGVHIPVDPQIYQPVLDELETMNIKLVEKTSVEPL